MRWLLVVVLALAGCAKREKCGDPKCTHKVVPPQVYCWEHEAACLGCGERMERVPRDTPEVVAVRLRYCDACRDAASTCAMPGCTNRVPVTLSGKLVCPACRDAMDRK